jgi:hypothetical protein
MVVVPLYLELASDEQWLQVEKALRVLRVVFFTADKVEGLTLEQVEKRVMGHSRETEFRRERSASSCKHDHLNMDGICHNCGEDRRGI